MKLSCLEIQPIYTTPTSPGFLLVGGNTDVDSAMQWLIDQSGGGDFVVIRASGTDAYNPYIYSELDRVVDSVETIIMKQDRAAYDPYVLGQILNAEALFIAGGNQWDYVRMWKGTPVEDAIHDLVAPGCAGGWDQRRTGDPRRVLLLCRDRHHLFRRGAKEPIQPSPDPGK